MEERTLRIFCPAHKISFSAVVAGTILCENGEHALADNFPMGKFWDYCCDCQHYCPSGVAASGKGRERCAVCERTIRQQYLCHHCNLLSFESDEEARRKAYTITQAGAVEPACPGCLSQPPAKLRAHHCEEAGMSFSTARGECPFCDEPITDPLPFPSSVADYLSKVKAKKLEARFDAGTNLLMAAQGGEFVLVPGGNGGTPPSIIIPRVARFETRQDYAPYENFYHCVDAAAGEVWIVHPAVVEKTEGGWRLKDIGRLDVRRDAPVFTNPIPPPLQTWPQAIPESCPKCSTPRVANGEFCGECGHRFGAADVVVPIPREPPPLNPPEDSETTIVHSRADEGVATETLPPPPASPGKRVGRLVAILAVVVVLALAAMFALNSGASLESKLDKAITSGKLFKPQGESAYDYYQQLKNQGADARTLTRFDSRLLPLLTNGPRQLLVEFAKPGTPEPSVPQWEEACKQLSWASQIKPGDNSVAARAAYCEGRLAYLNDNKEEARVAWQKASELDTSWAVATNGVGLIYNERKEYEIARPYLREAIRRDPDWAVPYNNLGTSYYYRRNYDEAETHYLKAVERAPNWGRPRAWLGDIARYRHDYARAVREYEIVLDSSTIGTSKMNLTEIRQRLDEARRLAEQTP
jgi:tetratricopeptide (TPR) repeat protein